MSVNNKVEVVKVQIKLIKSNGVSADVTHTAIKEIDAMYSMML